MIDTCPNNHPRTPDRLYKGKCMDCRRDSRSRYKARLKRGEVERRIVKAYLEERRQVDDQGSRPAQGGIIWGSVLYLVNEIGCGLMLPPSATDNQSTERNPT